MASLEKFPTETIPICTETCLCRIQTVIVKKQIDVNFFFCLFVLLLIIKRPHNMVKVLCIHWKMLNCEEKKIEESARKIHTRDMKNYLSRNKHEKKFRSVNIAVFFFNYCALHKFVATRSTNIGFPHVDPI